MDYDNNYFIVQNSAGLEWAVDRIGNVDCDLIFNVFEPNIDDDRNMGLQGLHDHGLYSPKQLRELKRLEQGILGTSMARPVVAKAMVDMAREVGADVVSHDAQEREMIRETFWKIQQMSRRRTCTC